MTEVSPVRRAEPSFFFATASGGTTIDCDALGGNPFASALIELAGDADVTLAKLPSRLRSLTSRLSGGHQHAEWTELSGPSDWSFRIAPGGRKERRAALIRRLRLHLG